jgi:SAM-dependent methyltransferase
MPRLSFDHYERSRLRKIARRCRGGSVLDLGYAHYPNPFFTGMTRVGLDLEPSRGPTRYEEELIGDVMDPAASLGDRRFDNVVAGELIEHVERPYDFLRGLDRHLAAGGRLILSTPNPVAWPCLLFEWLRSRRFYYAADHAYYFAPRWVERMLEDCGYRVEAVEGVGLLAPGVTLPCPPGLSYQVIYVAGRRGA